jgi:hypothetical protein
MINTDADTLNRDPKRAYLNLLELVQKADAVINCGSLEKEPYDNKADDIYNEFVTLVDTLKERYGTS